MSDPQKDEHIEELLSKLQGIFGKLSHSEKEEEEAQRRVESALPAPQEQEKKETPPEERPREEPVEQPGKLPDSEPHRPPPPPNDASEPPEAPSAAPSAAPAPFNLFPETSPAPVPPPAPISEPLDAASPADSAGYDSTVPLQDPEKLIVPTAVYFPPGREIEAKAVAQKLETMTPKFTKVAFRLRIVVFMPYDPKSDWKEVIASKSANARFQTAFVVMERPLDDVRRKAITFDLESRGVFFHEVPMMSIEKKAFYTDILLGLVFFFDSHKPSADAEESAS